MNWGLVEEVVFLVVEVGVLDEGCGFYGVDGVGIVISFEYGSLSWRGDDMGISVCGWWWGVVMILWFFFSSGRSCVGI